MTEFCPTCNQKVPTPRFGVGDYVEILPGRHFYGGQKATITEVQLYLPDKEESSAPYNVKYDNDELGYLENWWGEEHLKLIRSAAEGHMELFL